MALLYPATIPAPYYTRPVEPVYQPTDAIHRSQIAGASMTLDRHRANFAASTAEQAAVDHRRAVIASADAADWSLRAADTARCEANAWAVSRAGDHRMAYSTAVANEGNYRTLYSPSSAYGPVGPLGATAPYVSPYVAGVLHTR
eukprot:Sspe_Gene.65193::Locus_38605_Transcript_2_2_Confidence_0.667_Length_494::g.65193::m.65193